MKNLSVLNSFSFIKHWKFWKILLCDLLYACDVKNENTTISMEIEIEFSNKMYYHYYIGKGKKN